MKAETVYSFGGGNADGDAGMKNLLGGKGANLAEMAQLGIPVPPGFTITTEICNWFKWSVGRTICCVDPGAESHTMKAYAI